MLINGLKVKFLNSIIQNIIFLLLVEMIIINTKPIGFGIVRNISPSANFQQFLSALAKPSLDENNKIQYTYNMVSLAGFDEYTKYNSLQSRISPLMQWKNVFEMILGSRPTFYGTRSSQIQKYIINELFRPYQCRILMHVDLINSPISGKNPVSSTELGQQIVAALNDLSLDGVSIFFNDYNAVREGTASDWLESLLRQIKISTQNKKLIFLIVPPIFVSKMKLFRLQQINSIVDYYILKYYDTLEADYTSYQSIFEKSSIYPHTSMFQIMKSGTNIDICRTIVAKPATNNATWNSQQFMSQNEISSAFNQAFNKMGWFGGYANLNIETDKSGTFIKGILSNIIDQCIKFENCYC